MKSTVTRILKWAAALTLTALFLVYSILAIFLWWGDQFDHPGEMRVDPVYVRSFEPHNVELINDGLVSLKRRLDLIDRATKSIELEFFIYELDSAAKFITHKLIKAAQRGVKVRLLVDFAAPVFKLGPHYAKALNERGIEVRYYNTSSPFRFVSSQHRSHRKLLIVDGLRAITGGRNIGDDYFNLSEHYNFLDSDLMVEGKVVGAIRSSFIFYWNSELATSPEDVAPSKEWVDRDFIASVENSVDIASKIERVEKIDEPVHRKHVCNDIVFATDYSGIPSYNRQVFRRLSEFLAEAKTEVLGESPYFILKPDGLKLLQALTERGVRQTFLTNSLASTDAYYTVAAMTFTLNSMLAAGLDLRLYDGSRPDWVVTLDEAASHRWGVHAKRAVIDRKHIVIGTYNVDPRSANLNSELMVICRNQPNLAAEMSDDINRRILRSKKLFNSDSKPLDVLLSGASVDQKIMYILALPLANLFGFLL